MKKKFSKLLALSLSSLLLFSASSVVSASDINASVNDGNSVLLQSGWTQSEIDDLLTPEEVAKYANGTLVDATTHYVKQIVSTNTENNYSSSITDSTTLPTPIAGTEKLVSMSKEDFYREIAESNEAEENSANLINPQATSKNVSYTTSDGYMKYTMETYKLGTNKYQLNLRFEWVKNPSQRGIDIMALAHGPQLVQSGTQSDVTFTAKHDAIINGKSYPEYPIASDSVVVNPGGTAITFKLPTTSLNYQVNNIRGYMSYGGQKGNTSDVTVGIHGYYKHKVRSLNVAPTVTIPGGPSLTISSESTYETESPTPYFSFNL
ncbi:hypothetical protein [Paenibacillus xylanivorans]|uniref:Uncharacterized protein n=1 Tax=Paenibacillus xylanivorans TaxID=1705561 RepID=A0A0M9BRC7_9BACL|nr:hypothetical protein [Paenibacillus xylanivorans]KOY16776.1 hypothetical protein AMS66_07790 [Paenibacillus xylanivorans]